MSALRATRLSRLAPYVLVGAIGTFLFHTATQFDFHHREGVLGPDFWPKLILGLLVAVCAYEVVRIALTTRPDGGTTAGVLEQIARGVDTVPGPVEPPPESHPWRLLAGMAATIAYVALVATTGFFLTTAVYVAAFLVIGGYRNNRVTAMLSLGGALVLMFVFMKLVYISLPLGSGPFAQISILLMNLMGIR